MVARSLLTLCVTLMLVALTMLSNHAGEPGKPTLEQAYRKWHAGFAAKDKKDREKTLRSMLPNQKDIEYFFPKHAAKLGPLLAKGTEFAVENVDQIAKEVTRGGGIQEIQIIDMRKELKRPRGYDELFKIIPRDVPVFDISVRYVNGGGSYIYLHDRWLFIKDLDALPEILDKLK